MYCRIVQCSVLTEHSIKELQVLHTNIIHHWVIMIQSKLKTNLQYLVCFKIIL